VLQNRVGGDYKARKAWAFSSSRGIAGPGSRPPDAQPMTPRQKKIQVISKIRA
jgi:hypothetical protein